MMEGGGVLFGNYSTNPLMEVKMVDINKFPNSNNNDANNEGSQNHSLQRKPKNKRIVIQTPRLNLL